MSVNINNDLKSEIEDLQKQLTESIEHDNNNKLKIKDLEIQNSELKKRNMEFQSKLQELIIKNNLVQQEDSNLKLEIKKLKLSINSPGKVLASLGNVIKNDTAKNINNEILLKEKIELKESNEKLLLVISEREAEIVKNNTYNDKKISMLNNTINELNGKLSDLNHDMKDMQDKKLLKQRLLAKPAVMSKMAEIYRHLRGKGYDFMQDDNYIYASAVIEELIGQEPLPLKAKEDNLEAVMYIARQICLQFKKMVETNRMSELLYYDGKFKNEKAVQRLFLMMADGYCNISDIVLSPETDYGAGPVDFKFSSGYHSKVLLEMKLAGNSQLMHGIEVQLPTYLKAESTSKGIYMIVIANNYDEELVNALWKRMKAQNIPESLTQNIIVIDARKRNSASRL